MTSRLRIGALIDFDEWGEEIFNAVIDMLNNRTDGMWDDLLDNETFIDPIWKNGTCDETTAVETYWNDIRTKWLPEHLPHAIIGCHCSGASLGVARVAGVQHVPMVSMSATSYRLSEEYDFKNFFRTVAPDDERGQVGALVALFRKFKWDRVSVIGTNTPFSRDMATKFGEVWVGDHSATPEEGGNWTGTIAYSHTISLQGNDVDDESVLRALEGVPTNNPLINSRVILLIATPDHASRILDIALNKNPQFQPDTIWIGSDGWDDWVTKEKIPSLPEIPGYLTLVPFHNRSDDHYVDFLNQYNGYRVSHGNSSIIDLPIYAAETVDAILAVVHALVNLSPGERNNGTAVIDKLYNTNFTGITGRVAFDEKGRFRTYPQYQLLNLQRDGWEPIFGVVTNANADDVQMSDICWYPRCNNLTYAPSEKYDPPQSIWMYIVFPIIASLMAGLSIKYLLVQNNVNEMQKKLDAIDEQLAKIDDQEEDAKERKNNLLRQRGQLLEEPDTWSESTEILNEIFPEDDQYWNVNRELRKNMEDAWISRVWRVQNKPLWAYYSFHKDRLARIGIDDTEQAVWHGTSSLEPSIIHSDTQDGFMMQFSRPGLWGRGIYFATKSSYSHSYAYKPDESVTPHRDEREMFLAKLLVGSAVPMSRKGDTKKAECLALTVPPINPVTGLKYNTVKGRSGGSEIWVVYENGRAYPDYLVRYYRGVRDPIRTPYESKTDVMDRMASPARPQPTLPPVAKTFVWEYEDDGWHPIAPQSQGIVESAFLAYTSGVSHTSTQKFKAGSWTYEVDFDIMMQTNIDHFSHRQRKVRRTEVDIDV